MPENNEKKLVQLKKIIKEMVRQTLLNEDEAPGGGLTDMGALARVDKSKFMSKINNALASQDADIKKAAKELDLGLSTLYGYLKKEPKLQKVKDHISDELEKKEERQEQASEKAHEDD